MPLKPAPPVEPDEPEAITSEEENKPGVILPDELKDKVWHGYRFNN